jgi:hypothetical protein
MAAFDLGRDVLTAGDCAAAATQMEVIKKQMKVPLVRISYDIQACAGIIF